METMEDYKDELEASFRKIKEGDIISGTVIAVTEEEVTLDLKYFTQGIIKVTDLSNDPNFMVFDEIHNGDVIEAEVIQLDDGKGNILLSKKEANDVLAWEKLTKLVEEETVVTVRIRESVPGGVITFLEGMRAFIPLSQLSLDYVEDASEWIGREVQVRVITADQENNKLVLSAKSVAREEAQKERDHKIAMIVPGSIVEGTVESLKPYGAFVSIGDGLEGLVHISQICQRRIKKPSEVLKVGQSVKAKILNTNDNKIALSMKVLEDEMVDTSENDKALEDYKAGEDTAISTSLGDLLANIKL